MKNKLMKNNLRPTEQDAYNLIRKNKYMTVKQLEIKLNVGNERARQITNQLQQKKCIGKRIVYYALK